ncbi:hypothetical protein [Metamycoplasma canadense]|uniref:Uncharacterized protein n=1 Tax=Metamycoplasma canadense TaxID=29554 RepID=A0A077L6U7_9BACT|nr:hypothetical protein [Metamycoplasma canadense]BAP39516.1 hypothetical protein MCAN360_0316 [Metamycoplasma canadense]
MNKIFNNKLNILKEFIEICNENSLWYSLDSKSLLSLVNNLDYWYKTDYYQVFMTFESYEKLKEIYPNKILDSVNHSDYFSLQNKFVSNIEEINKDCPFIDINIIIPTSIKKVKKIFKFKNKIKSSVLFFSSISFTNIPKIKNKIKCSNILKNFFKLINYKDINEILEDYNYEGFLVTSPIINNNFLKKWLVNTNYNLRIFEKDGLKINVIAEYQNYLKNIYGINWKQIDKIEIDFQHLTPINIIKKENFSLS